MTPVQGGTSNLIGLEGGLNSYTYVNGNPVNYMDPLGLLPAYWAHYQKYGSSWKPTDASRLKAGLEGARFFLNWVHL